MPATRPIENELCIVRERPCRSKRTIYGEATQIDLSGRGLCTSQMARGDSPISLAVAVRSASVAAPANAVSVDKDRLAYNVAQRSRSYTLRPARSAQTYAATNRSPAPVVCRTRIA